ncbi:hypothetical protein ACLB2K_013590 [Fragaria x ananassa]
MDSNYTAKLVYSGEGAAVSFDHSVLYFDFANSVRDRFPVLGRSIVKLSASGSESVFNNNVSEESSVSFDENDYLGCYKPEEAKRYCSKGWENYIKSKDQKFQGGVEEFRLKLRMYAIEMRFEYHCHGVRLQTNTMMGSNIIKSIILDKVHENPNKKAIDIYHEIKSDNGMEVSYPPDREVPKSLSLRISLFSYWPYWTLKRAIWVASSSLVSLEKVVSEHNVLEPMRERVLRHTVRVGVVILQVSITFFGLLLDDGGDELAPVGCCHWRGLRSFLMVWPCRETGGLSNILGSWAGVV